MRRYFLLVLMVLIVSALACGQVETPEKVEPTLISEAEDTPTPPQPTPVPPTSTPTVFKVGDAVKFKDAIITVTKVEFSEGDEWEKPDSGKIFLLVHLHIENVGDEELSVNPWDYKVKDSNGVIIDTGFITFGENELPGAELAPGGKIDGMVPFEVVRGDPGLELIYQPNIFIDSERVIIQLGPSPQ